MRSSTSVWCFSHNTIRFSARSRSDLGSALRLRGDRGPSAMPTMCAISPALTATPVVASISRLVLQMLQRPAEAPHNAAISLPGIPLRRFGLLRPLLMAAAEPALVVELPQLVVQ